jgi:hypothetical protein
VCREREREREIGRERERERKKGRQRRHSEVTKLRQTKDGGGWGRRERLAY